MKPIDELKQLIAIPDDTIPQQPCWGEVESELEQRLPDDFKWFVSTYGPGIICGYFSLIYPTSATLFRERVFEFVNEFSRRQEFGFEMPYCLYPTSGGLLPFGRSENNDILNWQTVGSPNDWNVVVWSTDCLEFRELRQSFSGMMVGLIRRDSPLIPDVVTLDRLSGLPSFSPYTIRNDAASRHVLQTCDLDDEFTRYTIDKSVVIDLPQSWYVKEGKQEILFSAASSKDIYPSLIASMEVRSLEANLSSHDIAKQFASSLIKFWRDEERRVSTLAPPERDAFMGKRCNPVEEVGKIGSGEEIIQWVLFSGYRELLSIQYFFIGRGESYSLWFGGLRSEFVLHRSLFDRIARSVRIR